MNFTNLKNCMDNMLKEYNTPGVDCLVRKDHEVVFRYFTGMSDVENNRATNGNELYLIFSMTKMITCTAALQLFEKGKFSLDDPLYKYLPEFENMKLESDKSVAGNRITIKDLFTMGAGLDYNLFDDNIMGALKEGKKTTRELVRAMANKELGFEPGTRYRYSLCHDVLGALVEELSGDSLGEYMRKNIFEPLGMKNTFFGVPKDEEQLSRMAVRYTYDENGNPLKQPLYCMYNLSPQYESGGAGLTSCTEDYSLFLDALACGGVGVSGERILLPETVKLMGTNHLKGMQCEDFNAMRPGYGYGLGVRTHIDSNVSTSPSPLGEFGWDGAAGAFSLVDPKSRISLTYFQSIHKWNIKLQADIKNALYSDL